MAETQKPSETGEKKPSARYVPPSTRNKYPSSDDYGEIVTIEVGTAPLQQSFSVHKGVICFYSGYFHAAFHGRFQEAAGNMKLDTEDPSVFKCFVYWLYTRQLTDPFPNEKQAQDWYELWIFADRREIPLLMNAALDRIKEKVGRLWFVPGCGLPYVYENTVTGCGDFGG